MGEVVVQINSRSVETRHRLYDRVRNPKGAKKLNEIIDVIEEWEFEISKLVQAGGRDLEDEDRRTIALKMLPAGLPYAFIADLRRIATSQELKDRVRGEA